MSDKTLKSMATTEAANVAGADNVCPKCGAKEHFSADGVTWYYCQSVNHHDGDIIEWIPCLKTQLATVTRERDDLQNKLEAVTENYGDELVKNQVLERALEAIADNQATCLAWLRARGIQSVHPVGHPYAGEHNPNYQESVARAVIVPAESEESK